MAGINELFAPAGAIPNNAFPPRFGEAMKLIHELNNRCQQAQISEATQVSALMVELMPRLVKAYGTDGVAMMLGELINEITGTQPSSDTKRDRAISSPDDGFTN